MTLHASGLRAAALGVTSARRTGPAGAEAVFFLVTEGFDALALAGATEPLRLANALSGTSLYDWRIMTMNGAPVAAAGGMTVLADCRYAPMSHGQTLVVVGPPAGHAARDTLPVTALRRDLAHGARLVGLAGSVPQLARAGLLQGSEAAVHWLQADCVAEECPDVTVSRSAFCAGRVPTAPGGGAAPDLMLHLISERHGAALGMRVADAMVWGSVRNPQSRQTVSAQSRYGVRNARLVRVLTAMEANLETPLDARQIAATAGMSPRQTERLFAQHLNATPMGFYARLRMDRARGLLMQTELSVTEVALACGYRSLSHFAKVYRATYGHPPRQMRAVA